MPPRSAPALASLLLVALAAPLLPAAAASHAAEPLPVQLPGPQPPFQANHCALVDLQMGELFWAGAQCTDLRFTEARHQCTVFDHGLDCRVGWVARATASTWATPGSVAVRLAGPCEASSSASWGPLGAVVSHVHDVACTSEPFFVQRGTCVLQDATVEADFEGLLGGPDQARAYTTGVCDNRDPI